MVDKFEFWEKCFEITILLRQQHEIIPGLIRDGGNLLLTIYSKGRISLFLRVEFVDKLAKISADIYDSVDDKTLYEEDIKNMDFSKSVKAFLGAT